MKKNQTTAIKDHFESGKSLTSLEAIRLYGCTRLADKVFRLKKQGYVFHTEIMTSTSMYGYPCKYAKYTLVGRLAR